MGNGLDANNSDELMNVLNEINKDKEAENDIEQENTADEKPQYTSVEIFEQAFLILLEKFYFPETPIDRIYYNFIAAEIFSYSEYAKKLAFDSDRSKDYIDNIIDRNLRIKSTSEILKGKNLSTASLIILRIALTEMFEYFEVSDKELISVLNEISKKYCSEDEKNAVYQIAKFSKKEKDREQAFSLIFEREFNPGLTTEEAVNYALECEIFKPTPRTIEIVSQAEKHDRELNNLISENNINTPFNRIPKVNIAAIKTAVSEMYYCNKSIKIPYRIAVNEAVEIAKKYGDRKDYKFVNGVLGAIVKKLFPDN